MINKMKGERLNCDFV